MSIPTGSRSHRPSSSEPLSPSSREGMSLPRLNLVGHPLQNKDKLIPGTGKTATFSISVLQSLDTQVRETQALVLSPTRELALQIQKVGGRRPSFYNPPFPGYSGPWRLYERPVPCLYRRNKHRRRHPQAGLWTACRTFFFHFLGGAIGEGQPRLQYKSQPAERVQEKAGKEGNP